MTVQQQALGYFVDLGWTREQAAGIVANLQAESNFNPEAVGDGGKAYGIAQWHPDRQAHFAEVMSQDIRGSSLALQLAFVHAELQTTEKKAGDALRECTTAAEAGACVSKRYERPADKEGEAKRRALLAKTIFAQYGGQQTAQEGQGAMISGSATQPKEQPMPALALLQLFGPILAQMIPQIATLLDPKSEVAKRNVGIGQVVLDTIVSTANAPNLQGAIEAMKADPSVQKAVQAAIVSEPTIIGLLEVGAGGIATAREFSVAVQNADKPFWYNPAFWMSIILLPMAYWIVGAVLVGGIEIGPGDSSFWKIFGTSFNAETRSGVVNLVLGMVLGGIVGIWFGTSYGSMRKTELAAATEQATARTGGLRV